MLSVEHQIKTGQCQKYQTDTSMGKVEKKNFKGRQEISVMGQRHAAKGQHNNGYRHQHMDDFFASSETGSVLFNRFVDLGT